jgi:hypothetical protein
VPGIVVGAALHFSVPGPDRGRKRGARSQTDNAMIKMRSSFRRLPDFLFRHPGVAFVLMGASFVLFGVTSVNLYMLLAANVGLFLEYGAMVIADGALRQLAGLLASAALCILAYALFALCDRVLVRRLTEKALRDRRAE